MSQDVILILNAGMRYHLLETNLINLLNVNFTNNLCKFIINDIMTTLENIITNEDVFKHTLLPYLDTPDVYNMSLVNKYLLSIMPETCMCEVFKWYIDKKTCPICFRISDIDFKDYMFGACSYCRAYRKDIIFEQKTVHLIQMSKMVDKMYNYDLKFSIKYPTFKLRKLFFKIYDIKEMNPNSVISKMEELYTVMNKVFTNCERHFHEKIKSQLWCSYLYEKNVWEKYLRSGYKEFWYSFEHVIFMNKLYLDENAVYEFMDEKLEQVNKDYLYDELTYEIDDYISSGDIDFFMKYTLEKIVNKYDVSQVAQKCIEYLNE